MGAERWPSLLMDKLLMRLELLLIWWMVRTILKEYEMWCVAKMWGPGAEQGGILQTSSCRLDLKEPYYRMSQPQAYTAAQDQQQPNPLLQSQVVPFD
ncbi:probable histone-arginine methyltransferase 1.3 isoform X2 [Rutidosis leptorrhynchoides]